MKPNSKNDIKMKSDDKKHLINSDLFDNQYREDELIENIDYLFTSTIVKTQKKLSKKFIDEYILNEKYQESREDDICLDELLRYQPHYGKIKIPDD